MYPVHGLVLNSCKYEIGEREGEQKRRREVSDALFISNYGRMEEKGREMKLLFMCQYAATLLLLPTHYHSHHQ
jgi:hypothetical protein